MPLGFFPSPLYVPVRSACQPRGTENDAFPLLKGKLLINALVPSKTEAVPVAVAGVTVTVMTADRPTTPMDWGVEPSLMVAAALPPVASRGLMSLLH